MFELRTLLRIKAVGERHSGIEAALKRAAARAHLKGESITAPWMIPPEHEECRDDVWILDSPLPPESRLATHLEFFSKLLGEAESYLCQLKAEGASIEILCWVKTDQFTTGFHIPLAIMDLRLLRIGVEINIVVVNLGGFPHHIDPGHPL